MMINSKKKCTMRVVIISMILFTLFLWYILYLQFKINQLDYKIETFKSSISYEIYK
jgi:cell division protein FtsL